MFTNPAANLAIENPKDVDCLYERLLERHQQKWFSGVWRFRVPALCFDKTNPHYGFGEIDADLRIGEMVLQPVQLRHEFAPNDRFTGFAGVYVCEQARFRVLCQQFLQVHSLRLLFSEITME